MRRAERKFSHLWDSQFQEKKRELNLACWIYISQVYHLDKSLHLFQYEWLKGWRKPVHAPSKPQYWECPLLSLILTSNHFYSLTSAPPWLAYCWFIFCILETLLLLFYFIVSSLWVFFFSLLDDSVLSVWTGSASGEFGEFESRKITFILGNIILTKFYIQKTQENQFLKI